MNKEKIKNIIIVFLLIIIIALCAVIVYKAYNTKEDNQNKTETIVKDDFYNIDNLVNKNYITKIKSTEEDNIKIEEDKIIINNQEINLSGAKDVYELITQQGSCSSVYFILTHNNELYYTTDEQLNDEECKVNTNIKKVTSSKVENIYSFDKRCIGSNYPYDHNAIYAEINGDLIQVKVEKNNNNFTITTGKTFKENFQFPDLIVPYTGIGGSRDSDTSNYLISSDKKLYYNNKETSYYTKENSTELKYNNESITLKGGFLLFDNNDCSINDNYEKCGDYIYIIGTDNYLYKVNKDNTKLERVSDKKIINSKYINDGIEGVERYYEITFEDNNTTKYHVMNVSTLDTCNR